MYQKWYHLRANTKHVRNKEGIESVETGNLRKSCEGLIEVEDFLLGFFRRGRLDDSQPPQPLVVRLADEETFVDLRARVEESGAP